MVNMIFWFVASPNSDRDTIKTIVTSMAAVLTTTMTLRNILSVRGSLAQGGSFAGSSSAAASAGSRGTTHVISTRATNPGAGNNQAYLTSILRSIHSMDLRRSLSARWAATSLALIGELMIRAASARARRV